jgi:hypothetical protein
MSEFWSGAAGEPAPHISTRAESLLRHLRRAGQLRPLEERVGMSFDEILESLLPEISRVMPKGAEANLTDQDYADEVMIAWGRVAESRLGQALMLEDDMRAMSWQRRRHKRQEIVNRMIQHTTEKG